MRLTLSRGLPSVLDVLDITKAYELAAGRSADGIRRGTHIRVLCPSKNHNDRRPSCSLEIEQNVWRCLACNEAGGILDLPVAAGIASSRADAARWFAERLGLESPKSAGRAVKPISREKVTRSDIERELAAESEKLRQRLRLSESELLLSVEINAVRGRVSKRLVIDLPQLSTRVHEGSYAGRERDRLWQSLFTQAWCEAWVTIAGSPPRFEPEDVALHGPFGIELLRWTEDRAAALHREIVHANERDSAVAA